MEPNEIDLDDPDAALRAARERFIAAFPERCRSFGVLIDAAAADGATTAALLPLLHRTAGIGGMIGLPTVSARARELEDLIRDAAPGTLDPPRAHESLA